MQRTARLSEGATLTEVSAEIARSWQIDVSILPVSNDQISTSVTLADSGEEVSFQEYFVGLKHDVPISNVTFNGIERASATSAVIAAIQNADLIIVAPSNPIVSIAPVVSVPGVHDALINRTSPSVAISPIISGNALKGPAANMMNELGNGARAASVAALWHDIIDIFIIDDADARQSQEIAGLGITPFVTDTIMATPERAARLARATLSTRRLTNWAT